MENPVDQMENKPRYEESPLLEDGSEHREFVALIASTLAVTMA